MGKLTKAHARILVGMMPEEVRTVIKNFGKSDIKVAAETVEYLQGARLICETENLMDGSMIWVLTDDGKKVQSVL